MILPDDFVNKIICGDTLTVLKTMPDNCIDTIITSPPYWGLRIYLDANHPDKNKEIGLELRLEEYHNKLLQITAELKRILKPTGSMFWNHGDSYASSGSQRFDTDKYGGKSGIHCGRARTNEYQSKCMLMQNYRLVLKMIDEQGWILRNIIIWHKPNSMPSSVKDRLSNTYEPVFMLVKSKKYYFDLDSIREPLAESSLERQKRGVSENCKGYLTQKWLHTPRENIKKQYHSKYAGQNTASLFGRLIEQGKTHDDWIKHPLGKNPGDVWKIATQPFKRSHFATFPQKLIIPMIKAGCPANGIVLDPFSGAGTTCLVAKKLNRNYIGIELNSDYVKMSEQRIEKEVGTLF